MSQPAPKSGSSSSRGSGAPGSPTGLGRGLGQLMSGQGVAGAQPATEPISLPIPSAQTIKVEFGRGLGTLVSAPAPREEITPGKLLPPWFFFAADLVLLAFTAGICFDAVQPFDPATLLFCILSVSAGAFLSIIGVLQAAEATSQKPVKKE